jgi:hypothetical protein
MSNRAAVLNGQGKHEQAEDMHWQAQQQFALPDVGT